MINLVKIVALAGVTFASGDALAQQAVQETQAQNAAPDQVAPAPGAKPAESTPAESHVQSAAAVVPPSGPKSPTPPSHSTADHSKFKELQKHFASGPEVTQACVSCHTEADDQIMHSIHFTWDYLNPQTGQHLGKSHVINAFCGNVRSNEPRCTSCHAGYGWTDMDIPAQEAGVTPDCLACHDRSGQYAKTAAGAGHPALAPVKPGTKTIDGDPAWPVDLAKAAQSVGLPGRDNCGNCHFYGGGGDNVKHGDLSSALYMPEKSVDVHMSPDGENMTCSTCHVSDRHVWAGSRYNVHAKDTESDQRKPGSRRTLATCESCHTASPHPASLIGMKLNDHVDKLACQTCHIPEFARGGVATKTWWDWSTAGKLKDGKPYALHEFTQSDGKELHTYLSQKGDFKWGENVVPYYAWFDGQVEYTNADREIDPAKVVDINIIHGSPDDGRSRIWPFKRMSGRQAYDSKRNRLVYSHVFGPPDDKTAFWRGFDWKSAIAVGEQAAHQDYSGEFGFVDTHMYWPITHMVAPASDAVDCAECHAENGRMAGLAGVFMPGTDSRGWIGILGRLLLLAALAGVLLHGAIRIFFGKKEEGGHD